MFEKRRGDAGTVFARAQKLLDAQILSREDYENRLAVRQAADADVDAKTAAVEAARLNLEFTTVAAPVTGRVSDRRVSVGDTVVANTTPLTRVVTLDPIWFDFEGAESFYLKYTRQDKSGERRSSRYVPNPVEVQLADETGYPHRGRMVFVDNAIDTRSGSFKGKGTRIGILYFRRDWWKSCDPTGSSTDQRTGYFPAGFIPIATSPRAPCNGPSLRQWNGWACLTEAEYIRCVTRSQPTCWKRVSIRSPSSDYWATVDFRLQRLTSTCAKNAWNRSAVRWI